MPKLAPCELNSVCNEVFKGLIGKKCEVFRGVKDVAAQGEQEEGGMRRRGDRQEQEEPLVKGISFMNWKAVENLMSAQKFIDLDSQEGNQGRASEEVREALWKQATVGAVSGCNRIGKPSASGPPIN